MNGKFSTDDLLAELVQEPQVQTIGPEPKWRKTRAISCSSDGEEPQVQSWSTEPPELSITEVIQLELASMSQDAEEFD